MLATALWHSSRKLCIGQTYEEHHNTADSKADKSGDSHGIGLQNASKRLQLIYGDSFTLTEGEESDEGEENKLYRVSLTIPKQK